MDTMQAEALRRAREMHSVNSRAEYSSFDKTPKNQRVESSEEKSVHPHPEANENINQSDELSTENKLGTLFEDKEKLLILVLILVLLSENSADTSVLLALLYLII